MTYRELLKIEDDINLLNFRSNSDLPIWLYMRFALFNLILEKTHVVEPVAHKRNYGLQALQYLTIASFFNFSHAKSVKGRIMFFVDGQLLEEDGLYYNRYADPLIDYYPRHTILCEHAPIDWKWKTPRKNNNICFSGPNLAMCKIRAKLIRKEIRGIRELVAYVDTRLKNEWGLVLTDVEKEQVRRETEVCIRTYTKQDEWILQQAKRKGSKLLIMVGASLPYHYLLNKKAKEQGLIIAELQHGIISSSSFICNYGQAVKETKDFYWLSPEYYLAYGEYWGMQTGIGWQVIPIGNPMREKKISSLKPEEKEIVLVIGCANATEEHIQLAKRIEEKLTKYTVLFRPHPSERIEAERINTRYNVQLDLSEDVYSILSRTHILVSDISTVAYEAIGIVDYVFMRETPMTMEAFPDHPFIGFSEVEDLIDKIRNTTEWNCEEGKIWSSNSGNRYVSFIKQFM